MSEKKKDEKMLNLLRLDQLEKNLVEKFNELEKKLDDKIEELDSILEKITKSLSKDNESATINFL